MSDRTVSHKKNVQNVIDVTAGVHVWSTSAWKSHQDRL